MELNPPGQYADDRNLLARQRLWPSQVLFFGFAAWVLARRSSTPRGDFRTAGDVAAFVCR